MTNHEQCSLGWRLIEQGKPADAAEHFKQVLARDPNYAAALHGAGWVEHLAGRQTSAQTLIGRAIQQEPGRAEAHLHLAMVNQRIGRNDRAIALMRQAVHLAPHNIDYRTALAALLQKNSLLAEAHAAAREALRLGPTRAITFASLSDTFRAVGDVAAALDCARRSLDLDPRLIAGLLMLSEALDESGDPAGAEAALRRVLELDPAHAPGHLELAMHLLRQGRMAEGWSEWEWRLRIPMFFVPASAAPRWDPSIHTNGTLLVQSEQGVGDTIQFSRFLALIPPGIRVVIRASALIAPVLRTVRGVDEINDDSSPVAAHDWQIAIGSLPAVLGEAAAAIAASVPYVLVDGAAKERWSARVSSLPRPRVGIAWAGNPKHERDFLRSMPAAVLAPLLAATPQASWVSLQVEKRGATPAPIHDFTGEIKNFGDTAALIDSLDLVISVDTSTAHLAGALGKSTWTLLPYWPDWRWLTNREDSPWYPTMRLLRQQSHGDWESVVRRIIDDLRTLR